MFYIPCRCYFWHRKLVSAVLGLIASFVLFFVFLNQYEIAFEFSLFMGIGGGLILGTTVFVLWRETYCERRSLVLPA